jgi:hypothetical protein
MTRGHRWLIGVGIVLVLAAALALMAAGGQASLAVDGIIYVDADAGGANDGTSWTDAFTDLQLALAEAGSGDQIWVAEGTYKPTDGADRTISFQMKSGVALYGGFAGTETELGQRDWVLHQTILSGDLNGDDGPDFANNGENSEHVFYHLVLFLDHTAVLDGFTVSGGNAQYGGGMYNDISSPALNNVTFSGNSAWRGGGMYNYESSPALTNCTFSQNHASGTESWQGRGGGIYNDESSPSLTGCAFQGNSADVNGGGMYNIYGSSPALNNCTFSQNQALARELGQGRGGGIHNEESSPSLTNCTFEGNLAWGWGGGGGMHNDDNSSPTLTNCTFEGNWLAGMVNSYGSSPTLTNCILWGNYDYEILNYDPSSTPSVEFSDIEGDCATDPYNVCGEGNIDADPLFVDPDNGDFHLGPGSPCIDAGTNAAPDLSELDFEGDARIVDGDRDGAAIVDMGVDEVLLRVYLPVVVRNW